MSAIVGSVLVSVGAADDADNAELLDLERMCPQGTSLVLQFDRSPDFFLRSKVYENYNVYVAEEKGRIAGTAGATLKEFNVNGEAVKGVYIYDLRVHPAFRGRRIGSELVQRVMKEENEADLAYGIIMEDNYPSIALFKRLGFQKIHDFMLLSVPLYRKKEKTTNRARKMNADDAPRVVNLINDYYRNHDFFCATCPRRLPQQNETTSRLWVSRCAGRRR